MGEIVMCETLYPVQGKRVVIDKYGRARAKCGNAVMIPKGWKVVSLSEHWPLPLGSEKGLHKRRIMWWHSLSASVMEDGSTRVYSLEA